MQIAPISRGRSPARGPSVPNGRSTTGDTQVKESKCVLIAPRDPGAGWDENKDRPLPRGRQGNIGATLNEIDRCVLIAPWTWVRAGVNMGTRSLRGRQARVKANEYSGRKIQNQKGTNLSQQKRERLPRH